METRANANYQESVTRKEPILSLNLEEWFIVYIVFRTLFTP